jgi:hypothetical protein
MTIRIAASVLAIVAIGSIAAPAEISARGLVGGRALPLVGAHPPIVHPVLRAHTPLARFRHRRFFDNGFPAGVWAYPDGYGGSYSPAADAFPYDAPPDSYPSAAPPPPYAGPVRERIIYVMPARPSCSTQTYKVPSENGGERSINIVRC